MPDHDQHKDISPEYVDNAGKGELNDEMLPDKGTPQKQPHQAGGGDKTSTAGKHGDMAPESAAGLDKNAEGKRG